MSLLYQSLLGSSNVLADSVSVANLYIDSLTPNSLTYTNGSDFIASVTLTSNLTLTNGILDANQGILPSSSPTFADLKLTDLTNCIIWSNASHLLSSVSVTDSNSNLTFSPSSGTLNFIASPTFTNIFDSGLTSTIIWANASHELSSVSVTDSNSNLTFSPSSGTLNLKASPTFTNIFDSGLTSTIIWANASHELSSVSVTDSNSNLTFSPSSGTLNFNASPTFTNLTVNNTSTLDVVNVSGLLTAQYNCNINSNFDTSTALSSATLQVLAFYNSVTNAYEPNERRWSLAYQTNETGSNAGCNLAITSYADNGAYNNIPMVITRSSGDIIMNYSLTVEGASGLHAITTTTIGASGLITGTDGLTITGANSSFTSGTFSTTLGVTGLITGSDGLTITGANSSFTSGTFSTTLGVGGTTTVHSLYTTHNTIDDGSGNVIINSSSNVPLIINSTYGSTQIEFQDSGTARWTINGANGTGANSFYIYDNITSTYALSFNGTTNALTSLNNTLDDGTGNLVIAGTQYINGGSLFIQPNSTSTNGILKFISVGNSNYIESGLTATSNSVAPLLITGFDGGPTYATFTSTTLTLPVELIIGTTSNVPLLYFSSQNSAFTHVIDMTNLSVASPWIDSFGAFHYPNAITTNNWHVIDNNGNSVIEVFVDGTEAISMIGTLTTGGLITGVNGVSSQNNFMSYCPFSTTSGIASGSDMIQLITNPSQSYDPNAIRWAFGLGNNETEVGNIGSDLYIYRYGGPTGTFLGASLLLDRSTGAMSSTNNTLDNGSGGMAITGGCTINQESLTPLIVNNSTPEALQSGITFQINTSSKMEVGWSASAGCFIYDNLNGNNILEQGGDTSGYLKTLNNILDDGSGNSLVVGELVVEGDIICGSNVSVGTLTSGRSVVIGGTSSGVSGYTTMTNGTTTASGSGIAQVILNGDLNINNVGFIVVYVGATECYIPYWNNIN